MTETVLLRVFDAALGALHLLWTGFNAVGWAWRSTRRVHLVAVGITLLSWFGLGLAYGWGYCPLTDWHWRVKRALGEGPLPASWIEWALERVTGADWSSAFVDRLAASGVAAALALSAILHARDRRGGRAAAPGAPTVRAPKLTGGGRSGREAPDAQRLSQ